jgi:hypothetical protein
LELKLKKCLLISNDLEFVLSHLKASAKRVHDTASHTANSKPNDVKMMDINQQKESKFEVEPEIHFHKTFDLGMAVPDGHLDVIDTDILDAKKELFGKLLAENEEIRKVEMELLNADPTYSKNFTSNAINVGPI